MNLEPFLDMRPLLRARFLGFLATSLLALPPLHAQNSAKPDAAPPEAIEYPPPDSAVSTEFAALEKQMEAFEQDNRFKRAKLNAAREKLDTATQAGGSAEEVDKLKQEVDAWQSRCDTTKPGLAQLVKQMANPKFLVPELLLPGDNLQIFVAEDPAFNGKYVVRRGGSIIIPQVGQVSVAGKTVDQAQSTFRKALQGSDPELQRATVVIQPKVIAAGDNLEISVFEAPSFNGNYPVRGDGSIVVNGLDPVAVAGKTIGRAQAALQKALESPVLQNATVSIVATDPRKEAPAIRNKPLVEDVTVQKILDGDAIKIPSR
jgi:protein involved in polysaccharide export with SLBB domain